MKLPKKRKTYLVNILSEFLGAVIYSFMYFVVIGRFLSPRFDPSFAITAFAVGFAYFIAVYIPFHTYRIHLIPFISIIRALLKKSWRIIFHKLPAQLAGSIVGVGFMRLFLRITGDEVDFARMWTFTITDPYLETLLNMVVIYSICYLFSIIRLLFQSSRFSSTFIFALALSVIFFMIGSVSNIYALNPFGYLANALLGDWALNGSWSWIVLVYLVVPIATVVFTYLLIRDNYLEHDEDEQAAMEMP